ncbi:hypothetical protein [Rhabdochlamydiaceae symbiont of Dictyostelium giganteum]|uniref:hypothetical protein n=1 Tax=Rhabdochlamydiaceae symbiont of Dictyostelium giganteum TaxID=3342349 RepID=UPI00384B0BF9
MFGDLVIPHYTSKSIFNFVRYPHQKKSSQSLDIKTLGSCHLVCKQWDKTLNEIMNSHDLEKRGLLILLHGLRSSTLSYSFITPFNIDALKIIQRIPLNFFAHFKQIDLGNTLVKHLSYIEQQLKSSKGIAGSNFRALYEHVECLQAAVFKGQYNTIKQKAAQLMLRQLKDTVYDSRHGIRFFSQDLALFLVKKLPQQAIEVMIESFSGNRERTYLLLKGLRIKNVPSKNKDTESAAIEEENKQIARELYCSYASLQFDQMINEFFLNLGNEISHQRNIFYSKYLKAKLHKKLFSRSEKVSRLNDLFAEMDFLMYELFQEEEETVEQFSGEKVLWIEDQISQVDPSEYPKSDALELLKKFSQDYDAGSFIEGQYPLNQMTEQALELERKLSDRFSKKLEIAKRMIKGYSLLNQPEKAFLFFKGLNIQEQDFVHIRQVSSIMIHLIQKFPDFPESESLKNLLIQKTHRHYFWLKEAVLLKLASLENLKQNPSELILLDQKLTMLSDREIVSSFPRFQALLIMTEIYAQLEEYAKASHYLSRAWRVKSLMNPEQQLRASIKLIQVFKKGAVLQAESSS